MSNKSKFENIPIDPILGKKSEKEIKREERINKAILTSQKEQKEHIESGNPTELFRLKQGDEFLIPGSDRQYRLLVKYKSKKDNIYKEDKTTAREKGTSNIIELNDGNLIVTPILTKDKKHK